MIDHCTLWFEGNWAHCCLRHDLAYIAGQDRLLADLDLFMCVMPAGGLIMALIMLIGVRVFGGIFLAKGKK